MAKGPEVIGLDDHYYLAVSRIDGAARTAEGTVCMVEVGQGKKAPDDREAILLPLGVDGVIAMIARLQASLDEACVHTLH